MKGLVIREPWIGRILRGEKSWELRSRATRTRGRIALIRKGSGKVVGTAVLSDVLPALDRASLLANRQHHRVPEEEVDEVMAQGWVIPWVLSDVRVLDEPVSYCHPFGAVTWVDLGELQLGSDTPATLESAVAITELATASRLKGRAEKSDRPSPGVEIALTAVSEVDTALRERLQSVDIELSAGAIAQGYLPLRRALGLLPARAIGGGNRACAAQSIRVHLNTGGTVESDIDGVKMLLRARAPIRAYYEAQQVEPGSTLRLTLRADGDFELAPAVYHT